jgi:hypothetical protein
MPAKSFVMAFVWCGWLVAFVFAGLIVTYASFFGLLVLGLVVLCFSFIVDQDRDGAVGAAVTPGFLAQQVRVRAEMPTADRVAFRIEQEREARTTRGFRYLGLVMIAIGSAGFWFFQL